MKTTKDQQKLARRVAERMFSEGYTEFNDEASNECDRILGSELRGMEKEGWRNQRAAIRPLVQGRFRRAQERASKVPTPATTRSNPSRRVTMAQMVEEAYWLCRMRHDHLLSDP